MPVVICGGGIIGAAIAYYLALKGVKATVVERCRIACAASGKAGGFLARDWCDSYELGPLAKKSFDMHMEMAKTFTDCEYRRLDTYSVTFVEGRPTGLKDGMPEWIDGPVTNHSKLGQMDSTAQVHPYKLTHSLLAKAKEMVGTEVVISAVTGMQIEGGKVTGVKTTESVIEADVVVVALGPWSGQASEWFRLPTVTGQRAHSIRLRPKKPVPGNALFADYRSRDGQSLSPEVYPRPNNEVYVCGMSDEVALPEDPSKVLPNENSIRKLRHMAETMSSHLVDAEFLSSQACYLPIPSDGLPLIGAVPEVSGAYIATGHTCWGILNATGTGAALAELIVDGKSNVIDLSPFDPARHF